MTTQQITFLLPPLRDRNLDAAQALEPDAFARLDSAIGDGLREPCRNGIADAANDPRAIEFDSWLIHLH